MQSLLALLLALPLWLACCQPVGMLSFWHVSGVWHVFCVLHLLEADGLSLKAAEVLCHFDICGNLWTFVDTFNLDTYSESSVSAKWQKADDQKVFVPTGMVKCAAMWSAAKGNCIVTIIPLHLRPMMSREGPSCVHCGKSSTGSVCGNSLALCARLLAFWWFQTPFCYRYSSSEMFHFSLQILVGECVHDEVKDSACTLSLVMSWHAYCIGMLCHCNPVACPKLWQINHVWQ